MKKLLFLLCICVIPVITNGQSIRYDTIRYAKEHYQDRVTLFKSEPVRKGSVIFVGNSLTEFCDWKRLLHDSSVINRGIAADNTFGVLDRLEDIIIRQPTRLFIEIGINDISQNIPVPMIAQNILTIVERVSAKSPDTRIYVLSILPTNDNVKTDYPDAYNKNVQINQVNKLLKSRAMDNKFAYVDLNIELRDKNGKLDTRFAKADGLHLNETGYEIWANLIRRLD